MSLVTLGLSGALGHDAAAALFVDGKLVAAVEEERLVRRKHAKGYMPRESAMYCLRAARVKPRDVNIVTVSYAPISIFSRARWHYARRYWYAPDRSLDALFNGNRRYRRYLSQVKQLLHELKIPWHKVKFVPVQHQLAHASSAYHMSGFEEKTAILTIDMKGEYASMFLGYGENGKITKIKQFYDPDSLAGMYGAVTDYLGFDMLDGDSKVMGMATYGDPEKYDLSSIATCKGKKFSVNTKLIGTVGIRRHKDKSRGHFFSNKLLQLLGPRRAGEMIQDPYIHYAASIQKLYEDYAVTLVNSYLGDILKETGKLAFAGTGALNVKLNQRLAQIPDVKELFVPPSPSDAGTAIGAAAYTLSQTGVVIEKESTAYLGPRYTTERCIAACAKHRDKPLWELLEDPAKKAAELIEEGHLLGWFQGRMEFGPRSLGNRAILGSPSNQDSVDAINKQIKFRENWRSFSASIIDTLAKEILQSEHPARFMNMTFDVSPQWKERIPAVVYKDGTMRAHVVAEQDNSRFYNVLKEMENIAGFGIVLNTSLNRPGEAMICSPEDALNLFFGSDLEYLIMQDILVTKRPEPDWEN
ncbi:MAG: carbamoyltransferase C-terminal domain-containing protein [Pseudohongiellaceae bacterium]|nr:carbamoyltransferase C-terminal domain-containing protein [Pseudohongiellaceae bacterium]